jgi:hypothetical protein
MRSTSAKAFGAMFRFDLPEHGGQNPSVEKERALG